MRKLSQHCYNLLKKWEGCKLEAYQDTSNVWTIGYGSTFYSDGSKVKAGDKINASEAGKLFKATIGKYEKAVDDLVRVDITDNQFGALVSFCYNVGITAFKNSTLLKKVNAKDFDAVPPELMRWIYSGKKVVPGLVNRRSAESGLWVSGSYVSSYHVKAKSYGKKSIHSAEQLTPLAGIFSGLGGMAYGAGPVQWAFAIIMVIAVTFILYQMMKKHKEEKR